MDRYSTIGARRSGLDFKLPVITFLRTKKVLKKDIVEKKSSKKTSKKVWKKVLNRFAEHQENDRFAEHQENICILEYFSRRKYVLSVVLILSNNLTERYLLFLSVLECWPWCSIPLQVGAIFDANYLLMEWESRQSVLVNPQNSMLLHLIASR